MVLSPRLSRLLAAAGVDAASVPREIWTPAPFGQSVPELDALLRWLGSRDPERLLRVEPTFAATTVRVRAEALRALVRVDPAAAARHADAVVGRGPLESVLGLGALARMSAQGAAAAAGADAAVLATVPLLSAPRPVARLAALRLGEIGVTEGALGRRARAVLEDALLAALQAAHDLGATGELAAMFDPALAELALPGTSDRVAAATGRIVDLVGVLGALAAHREGLTMRLSALAPRAPRFVGPVYVVAYLAALGAADRGPYLAEVHERLERAADDNEPRVRALAVEALGGHASETPALANVIASALTDADGAVRTAAALALAEVGSASDAAVRELEDMIELGGAEEALAATRALARCHRVVPERVLAEIDDPLVQASARLLARPDDDDAFASLVDAYADASTEAADDVDEHLQPMAILVDALRAMPQERSTRWLAQFVAGEPRSEALGEVLYQALDDCDAIPQELVDAGTPLLDVLARDDERAPLAALVAARLVPADPRLERLIVERTEAPVSLLALAALDRLGDDTCERLLAVIDEPDDEQASLAAAALGRCDREQAPLVAAALAPHIRDDDPLSDAAHAALLELVDRGCRLE